MLDIRLRLANDDGTPGRVLDTIEIAWTGYSAQTVKFTVSEKTSEKLDAPFLVLVEHTTSAAGRWKRVPRNDLFIVDEDSADSVDTDGVVKFTAAAMLPWLAARYPLWWRNGDSVDDLERRYTDRTPGFVLRDLIQVAQREQGWGSRVTFGFSDATDSAGQAWNQRVSQSWPLFTTPLSRVMQTLAEQGYMEWWASGFQLNSVNPGTGVDRSDTVTLGGPGFTRAPASRKFDPATAIVVQYDQGWTHFNNPGAEGRFGNLFKVMTQSGAKTRDVAEKNVQPALAESRAMQEELSYEWELSGDGVPVPWESFQVGDVVTARTRRGKKVLRVIGLDVSKDSKGLVKATAVVGSKLLSLQAKLAKRSAAASVGQIIGGSGVALPPAAAPAKTAPLPPSAVRVASNVGSWGEDGSERSTVTIAWDAVSQAVDGLAVDIDTYEVWSRPVNEPMSLLTRTTALSTTVETWTPGENRLAAVRARSRAGVWSQLSPEIGVTPARPVSIVPKAPTGLAVASNTGAFASDGSATATVRLTWDAVTQDTDGGLVQVVAYEVLVQDGQAWTPLLETTAREVTITVPPGKARGIRVRARTALGVWGDPSATTTVTGAAPAQVTTALAAPTLTTGLGLVVVASDGKLASGAALPSSFQMLYAETAPASTGPWTRVGVPARGAGQVATVRGTVGATMFARLVWVDTLGRTSAASASASIKVASVTSGELDEQISGAITKAQGDATTALENAQKAAIAASGKSRVYTQPEPPSPVDVTALWFDTDDGNKPYVGTAAPVIAQDFGGELPAAGGVGSSNFTADASAGRGGTPGLRHAAVNAHQHWLLPGTFDRAKGYEVEVWVRLPSDTGTATSLGGIVIAAADSTTTGYQIILDSRQTAVGATSALHVRRDASTTLVAQTALTSRLVRGAWYRLSVTATAAGFTVRAFDDTGAQQASLDVTGTNVGASRVGVYGYGPVDYDDLKIVVGAPGWVPVQDAAVIAAAADAAAAQKAADAAKRRADDAYLSAASKNVIWNDTTSPDAGDVGTREGDIWQVWSSLGAGGKLLETWRWTADGWVRGQLDESYLPLVNIGEGTYGKLTGVRLDAESIWAEEAWLDVMRGGVVETSMLTSGFGQNLDISANGAITLIAGQVSDQAAELSTQRSEIDGVTDQVSSLGGQVGEVRSSASAAAVAAAAAQAAAREAQDKADGLAAYVRITSEGLEVGSPGAATAVKITPSNMTFNVNGVPGAYLDAGQFIAPRFVGEEVDLANVKIQKQGTRTVVKAI